MYVITALASGQILLNKPKCRHWVSAWLVLALSACSAQLFSASPRWNGAESDHFDGTRFYGDEEFNKGLRDLIKYYANSEPGEWHRDLTPIKSETPPQRVDDGSMRVTFINHATVLIQVDGINVLTDPIWSDRASPLSWAGPKRYQAPGLAFEQLPPIDLVLISHNHFDHMDEPTIRRLNAAHAPLFVVPAGDALIVSKMGVERVIEMDWGDEKALDNGCALFAVPVQHWSQRRAFPSDRNLSLWAGYVLHTRGGPVYIAGDTGYDTHFSNTRIRHGKMRLALLPIGAYKPRWLTEYQHMSPDEALTAHLDLEATESLAIHWGTFELADDGQFEPVETLKDAMNARGVQSEFFHTVNNGGVINVAPANTGACQ